MIQTGTRSRAAEGLEFMLSSAPSPPTHTQILSRDPASSHLVGGTPPLRPLQLQPTLQASRRVYTPLLTFPFRLHPSVVTKVLEDPMLPTPGTFLSPAMLQGRLPHPESALPQTHGPVQPRGKRQTERGGGGGGHTAGSRPLSSRCEGRGTRGWSQRRHADPTYWGIPAGSPGQKRGISRI